MKKLLCLILCICLCVSISSSLRGRSFEMPPVPLEEQTISFSFAVVGERAYTKKNLLKVNVK